MRAKQENSQMMMSELEQRQAEYEQFKAKRREEGLKIDAETAEVAFWYTQVVDPYEFWDKIDPEFDAVGRSYFARNPGSNTWVEFGDLPDETRETLWRTHHQSLAFSAAGMLEVEVRRCSSGRRRWSERMRRRLSNDEKGTGTEHDRPEAARPQDPR